MNRRAFTRIALISFSLFETVLAVDFYAHGQGVPINIGGGPVNQLPHDVLAGTFGVLWSRSIPLSLTGWFLVGLMTFWRKTPPQVWRDAGFNREIFDLMVRMRGAASRLKILYQLDSPKHRSAISDMVGIDWREVDRQLNLLRQYGLVSVVAEAGSMKMFGLTEQGRMLLRLIKQMEENVAIPRLGR